MSQMPDRRDVLKTGLLAGAALAVPAAETRTLRFGVVGVGGRGTGLLDILLRLGVEVPAVCDIDEANLARAQKLVESHKRPRPEGYSRSETDFRRMCDRKDLDVVLNATPWEWHVPVSVAAMKAGKHVASEVPGAYTLEGSWELVETAESTGRQYALLENDCYYRHNLAVLNMFRGGLLGEPLFAEGGYCHDLRTVQYNLVPHGEPWRLDHSIKRNGNQYPTHPLGPIAWWMDINRGDRLDYLVSVSSKSAAMQEFAAKTFGASDPRAKTKFAQGDVNTTLIRTEQGRLISLYFDTSTPRAKEINMRVQGSKGVFSFQLNRIFVEGRSNKKEGSGWLNNPDWEAVEEYEKEFEHRLWKTQGENARTSGHGGGDYMVLYRMVKCLRENRPVDIDVYDAAAWSAVSPLSEQSVAQRNRSIDVPDFTRGKWKTRPPLDSDAIV